MIKKWEKLNQNHEDNEEPNYLLGFSIFINE